MSARYEIVLLDVTPGDEPLLRLEKAMDGAGVGRYEIKLIDPDEAAPRVVYLPPGYGPQPLPPNTFVWTGTTKPDPDTLVRALQAEADIVRGPWGSPTGPL